MNTRFFAVKNILRTNEFLQMSNKVVEFMPDVNKLHNISAKFSKSLENEKKMCYNVLS